MLISPVSPLLSDNFESDLFSSQLSSQSVKDDMSMCRIPQFLRDNYLNGTPPPVINELHDWQKELLMSDNWLSGKNCIVHVPTAGGKTLIAEVAIAQLLERNPTAKAIYCVPFVSLAAEKYEEFQKKFRNFSVLALYQNIGSSNFSNGQIAVCTFERAHAVINSFLKTKEKNQIELIVVDEFHMIGDESRGPTVEALVCKAMMMEAKPRIVGLSATVNENDLKNFANWMNGFSFTSGARPATLSQFVLKANGSLCPLKNGEIGKEFSKFNEKDKNENLAKLLAKRLNRPGSTAIIFVNTRKETLRLSAFLSKLIYLKEYGLKKADEGTLEKRKELADSLQLRDTDQMRSCIMNGIGFHHAGLTLEERSLIEDGFRNGTIFILVATTTLSAGINFINISLVVVYNVTRTLTRDEKTYLSQISYMQMAGRAGRIRERPGTVVVVQQTTNEDESRIIKNLSRQTLPQVKTFLLREGDFDRFFLQCLFFIGDEEKAISFAKLSYESCVNNIEWKPTVDQSIERLKALNLYEQPAVTTLGAAIASANFSISEGIEIDKLIKKHTTLLSNDLFCMFLCISPSIEIRTPQYIKSTWELIVARNEGVIKEVTGIGMNEFQRMINNEFLQKRREDTEGVKLLDRFYIACLLIDLTDEISLRALEAKYEIERGLIQNYQNQAAVFAGQITKFSEVMKQTKLNLTINKLRKRIEFGVKSDLIELIQLGNCSQLVARALVNNGINNASDVFKTSNEVLTTIIREVEPKFFQRIVKDIKAASKNLYETEKSLESFEEM